jgi:serine/threonine protein kinase
MFEKLAQVGEGTFGKVFKARNKETGELVALKRVRMDNEKEGFPVTAIREIKILKQLNHPNVVRMLEIVTADDDDAAAAAAGDDGAGDDQRDGGGIYLVFEFMDHDLTGLSESNQYGGGFPLAQIKCYMAQMLEGLFYCHRNNVLHRDLKGSNLLINNRGELKLADFGLARPFNEKIGRYTNRVITLWYRPPELLLGETHYDTSVDIWSAGAILAEMLRRQPLFPGVDELDQLNHIYDVCGTPTPETWPGVDRLPWYKVRPKADRPPRLAAVPGVFGRHRRARPEHAAALPEAAHHCRQGARLGLVLDGAAASQAARAAALPLVARVHHQEAQAAGGSKQQQLGCPVCGRRGNETKSRPMTSEFKNRVAQLVGQRNRPRRQSAHNTTRPVVGIGIVIVIVIVVVVVVVVSLVLDRRQQRRRRKVV